MILVPQGAISRGLSQRPTAQHLTGCHPASFHKHTSGLQQGASARVTAHSSAEGDAGWVAK